MASSSSDLTLDYKPNGDCGAYPGQAAAATAAAALVIDHHLTATGQATQKLQEFLSRLEEERLKIDAFKRELPLCMQLLNHAMEAYRQQLEAYQMGSQQAAAAAVARPLVLEEFIPIKNIGIDVAASAADKAAGGNVSSEKASWMVSAQLWNAPAADAAPAKGPQTPKEHHPLDTSPKLSALDGGGGACQRGGGAFLPFSKDSALADGSAAAALPELALAPAEKDTITVAAAEVDKKLYVHDVNGSNNGAAGRPREAQNGGKPSSTAPDGGQAVPPQPQPHRKARRCWSPELHRRFVNALQILGGAQVATPKQIRELMKVDGLTNDEVKSHLQKYRLHTRRPMPAPAPPTAATPQLVVLGGIWVPPEYATQAAGPAIYGGHPATQPHYTAAVAAQEYYHHHHHQPPAAAVHHLQHHPAAAALVHHRAVQAAAPPPPPPPQQLAPTYSKSAAAARVGSPTDSDQDRGSGGGGGCRDRSESIDEEGEGDQDREDDDDDNDNEMEAATTTNSAIDAAADDEITATTSKY
ncbi:transcription factor NIGTH1-like [Oryza brachyantha]|uniref:transcription factor NIGTH1-like n=1 Tax=Oryza brachyantha TaxID=4533 RepID=UPI001ADA1DCD|nr:transcription factor NIGTH1-like [Oryza brachyantha]